MKSISISIVFVLAFLFAGTGQRVHGQELRFNKRTGTKPASLSVYSEKDSVTIRAKDMVLAYCVDDSKQWVAIRREGRLEVYSMQNIIRDIREGNPHEALLVAADYTVLPKQKKDKRILIVEALQFSWRNGPAGPVLSIATVIRGDNDKYRYDPVKNTITLASEWGVDVIYGKKGALKVQKIPAGSAGSSDETPLLPKGA
jgi:hypothetical protein